MKIVGVRSEDLSKVWHLIAPLLASACEHADGMLDVPTLRYWIETNVAQLWIVVSDNSVIAAAVTKIITTPKDRTLHICTLGGTRMNEWLDTLITEFDAFAKHYQCRFLAQCGRTGWSKILKNRGWKVARLTMTKELK